MTGRTGWDPGAPVGRGRPDDVERPNPSRMDDYLLGGTLNFEVDRREVDAIVSVYPDAVRMVRAHRAFVGRAVRWCATRGIDQFLDLGSGFPGVGSVHEIARRVRPDARVVYVDADPVTVAHGREIVDGRPGLAVVDVDLTRPAAVLGHPEVAALLDRAAPVAVVLTSVLHLMSDRTGRETLAGYRERLPAGSVVVLSHAGREGVEGDPAPGTPSARALQAFRGAYGHVRLRSPDGVRALLKGFTPVEPGLVDVARWPAGDRPPVGVLGGVALAD